jgi:hypothetical protein
MRKDPSGMDVAGVLLSYCGVPPCCLSSGPEVFCACSVAVRASIFRSSSATRLSAFFWRFLVGGVVMLGIVSPPSVQSNRRNPTKRGQPLRIVYRTHLASLGRIALLGRGRNRMRAAA